MCIPGASDDIARAGVSEGGEREGEREGEGERGREREALRPCKRKAAFYAI